MSRELNSPVPSEACLENEANDEDPPVEAPPPAAELETSTAKKKYENRNFILSFGKDFYVVPSECVEFDAGRPVATANGLEAFKLHDSKSFPMWKEAGISERHIIKLAVTTGGERQVGWYMTFKIGGQETDDVFILRSVHKTIAEKLYALWTGKEVPEERKKKYAGLLAEKPSFSAQINPKNRWTELKDVPSNVLYTRPKKETKGSKRKQEDDDYDGLSSATTNKGTLALAPQHNHSLAIAQQDDQPVSQEQVMASRFGGGNQIFMNHPDSVIMPQELFREVLARLEK